MRWTTVGADGTVTTFDGDCSGDIAELAGALARAQSKFPVVMKAETASVKSDKGSYSYSYADLAACWDAVRKHLGDEGLSVVQMPQADSLVTLLLHASGQWLSCATPLFAKLAGPQAYGAAVSYARRYALSAMVGIPQADSDALGLDAAAQTSRPAPQPKTDPAPAATNGGSKLPAPRPFDPRVETMITEYERKIAAETDIAELRKIPGDIGALKLPQEGVARLRKAYAARKSALEGAR